MKPIVCALLSFVSTLFRSRHSLQVGDCSVTTSAHCISEQPSAHELIPGTVYSGPGLLVNGQGVGMHCFFFRQEP